MRGDRRLDAMYIVVPIIRHGFVDHWFTHVCVVPGLTFVCSLANHGCFLPINDIAGSEAVKCKKEMLVLLLDCS